MTLDFGQAALVFGVLLVAGTCKGVLGLGIAFISAPILATMLDVPRMVVILAGPVLCSNIYQAFAGGFWRDALRRHWTLLVGLLIGVSLGARLLFSVHETVLFIVLGIMLLIVSGLNLLGIRPRIPRRWEHLLAPVVGLVSGFTGGMTTMFQPPLALYMVSLGLTKDALVATSALVFTVGSAFLLLNIAVSGKIGADVWAMSLLALIPVMIGTVVGQRFRRYIPEETFIKVLMVFLMVLGLNLTRRGLGITF